MAFRNKCLQIESRVLSAQTLSSTSRASIPQTTRPTNAPSNPKTFSPRVRPETHAATIPATGANLTPVLPRMTTQGGDAMDLSRFRGILTLEEKQRRRDNNLCLYCGQPGHIAANHRDGTIGLSLVDFLPPENE